MEIKIMEEKLKKDFKRYKSLEMTTRDETYKLAYSMLANYIEELLEILKEKRN